MTQVTQVGKASYAVDPARPEPLYIQVERHLLARIRAGEWNGGDRIPTESELGASYGVSRVTMRQAMRLLVDRGLVVRARGRGTFVRDGRLTAGARSVSSFTTEIRTLGMAAGSSLMAFQTVAADEETADLLQRPTGEPLYRIRRLRTGDGQPIGVQTSLLVAERFPGLPEIMAGAASLYAVLREYYGVAPVEAVETFTVGRVPTELAAVLELPRGSPVFNVERLTFDGHGAFERTTSVMRGDRYQIRLALRNP